MITNNGTIFDNVRAEKIEEAHIPEDEIFEKTKKYSVNHDKFNYNMIVDDHKIPSFKFVMDNSLNDFYEFPDIVLSQNPEYKYKYPHLSTAEYMKQMYETEEGTPNELNTYMRSLATGESIDDIKKLDEHYQSGLKELDKIINSAEERLKGPLDLPGEKEYHEEKLDEAKRIRNTRKIQRYNPVKIQPAITLKDLDKKFIREMTLNDEIRDKAKSNTLYEKLEQTKNKREKEVKGALDDIIDKSLERNLREKVIDKVSANKIKNAFKNYEGKEVKGVLNGIIDKTIENNNKREVKAVVDDIIDKTLEKNNRENVSANKIKNAFKKYKSSPIKEPVEESTSKEEPKGSQSPAVKRAKQFLERKIPTSVDDSNEEEKTVIEDANPQTETFKVNFQGFKKLIGKYDTLPDSATIEDLKPNDQSKIKGYMKILGIPAQTKRLQALRSKLNT